MKGYKVRQYEHGDEGDIVELLELVFDGWPRFDVGSASLDHWRWKYLANPIGMVFSFLAFEDSRIIGCIHGVPRMIKLRGEAFLGIIGADLAVHPDYRGVGVTKDLDKEITGFEDVSGVRFGYFISGNPVVLKILDKEGYTLFPHKVVNLVRIKDIDLHLEEMPVEDAWYKRLGFHIVDKLNNLRNTLIGYPTQNPDIDVNKVPRFDERINDFWSVASKSYDFIVERRMKYLNWRFCDSRAGVFVIKQAEEDKRILGYSVLSINRFRTGYPIGYIVDLLTLPDRSDALEALIHDAVRYFDSNEINLVNHQIVQGHPYEGAFKRHGFLNSRVKIFIGLHIKKMEKELTELKDCHASRIFLSWGDHDVLPAKMPSYR